MTTLRMLYFGAAVSGLALAFLEWRAARYAVCALADLKVNGLRQMLALHLSRQMGLTTLAMALFTAASATSWTLPPGSELVSETGREHANAIFAMHFCQLVAVLVLFAKTAHNRRGRLVQLAAEERVEAEADAAGRAK